MRGSFGSLSFFCFGWLSLENINVLEYTQRVERRLSVDWNKIKAEYIAGGTSYRKLAQKHELKLSALRNVAEKEKWVELKAQAQHKSNTKIVNAISEKEAKKAVDIVCVADRLLEKILEAAEYVHDTQSIKQLTSAIKDIKDIKGIKSEADMREQEARIAKLQKEAEADDNSNTEVTVTFGTEGDRNKWAE
jgi:cytidylate kinase